MDRAKICIPRILKHEGGYVNHPNDPGGATNKGITLATYRTFINPRGTVADLKKLTEAEAVKVYRFQYWNAVKADQLPVGVDYAVADFAVNSGPHRAAKFLQRVVGADQDGKIGPQTIGLTKQMKPADVINALCDDRMEFLQRLSTWGTFGRGWSRRVSEVRADSLTDAIAPPNPPDVEPAPAPSNGLYGLIPALLAALAMIFKRKS